MGTILADHGFAAKGNLLSAKDYRLFADTGFDLDAMLKQYGPYFIACAERDLNTPYPILDASLYMQYARIGNRANFEGPYFKRRVMTCNFAFAELAERKGRFTDRVIDGVWHILEESTWILPAHNATNKNNPGTPLPDAFFTAEPDDDVKHIDLFSAGTAGRIAFLWYILGDVLDPQTPVIRRRMLSQLRQRILHPFYTYDHDWWMGTKGNTLNNWAPWIVSNILTVIALCEDDDEKREFGVQKCMTIMDRFTRTYPSDGGCDEGPGYWGVAGASYFDCLEELYDLSGGKIDVFGDPLVNKICEYIMNFSITKDTYINFADAGAHVHPNYRLIHRMGRRLHNDRLMAFAASIAGNPDSIGIGGDQMYRNFRDMQEPYPQPCTFTPKEKIWYDGLQVAITRDPASGMFLALKGGNNGESHNHNDVGQFILFDHAEPVILDAGVEQYCRDTFSSRRYTLWAMRAANHNIPEISGVEQQPGGNYHAETAAYDEASGALTLELKNAYPPEAHIDSYRRTAVLNGSRATVTDEVHLTQPGEIAFHYLTVDKPEIDGTNIRFASGHTASFDPALVPSVNEIDLNHGNISRTWKRDFLYRITLTAANVKDAVYVLTIGK